MIAVTRLNGRPFAVNPDLIARVESNPDTTLILVDGTTYLVRESVDEVISLVVDFRARVIAAAQFGYRDVESASVEGSVL
jgi:flagellar protein FlbD